MEPAALIVSGSWHLPIHYAGLANSLHKAGFRDVRNPKLPTAVEKLPVPAEAIIEGDTKVIRAELASLADAAHSITIFCHSYGGVLASNSVDGFLWAQRKAAGKPGGVVHIVYMAAFIIPVGTALGDSFGGKIPEWLRVDEKDGTLHISDHRMSFYNDLDDAEAQTWAGKCVHCSLHCFQDKLTSAPYEYIGKGLDATYLVCKQDYRLIEPIQEAMATLLGEDRKMEYIDVGHCAMVGAPEEVASVVWRAWESSKSRLEGSSA
ncbi:hypothetical protein DPSP01_014389 [Paraphaeosphaeria sporulosa]